MPEQGQGQVRSEAFLECAPVQVVWLVEGFGLA